MLRQERRTSDELPTLLDVEGPAEAEEAVVASAVEVALAERVLDLFASRTARAVNVGIVRIERGRVDAVLIRAEQARLARCRRRLGLPGSLGHALQAGLNRRV